MTLVPEGIAAPRLEEMPLGGVLEGTGPFGTLLRSADPVRPEVYLAAGTGVAPFRPMIRAALDAPGEAPVLLLLGGRDEADLLFHAEWGVLSRAAARLTYWPIVSHGGNAALRRGEVADHVTEAAGRAPGARWYVCGLRAFVNPVLERLLAVGVARGDMLFERYD